MEEAWLGPGLLALRWWAILLVQVVWRRAVGPGWTLVAAGLGGALALGSSGGGVAISGVAISGVAISGVAISGVAISGGAISGVAISGDPWLLAAAELLLGALVGLCVALPGHALVGSAEATARVLGTAPGPWRALVVCLVGAVGLELGLHRPLLLAGEGLVEAWPPGEPQAWASAAETIPAGRLAHAMALLALTLATPALLAGAVVELSARLLATGSSAVMPAGATAASWGRVAAALVATGASWAAYEGIWAQRVLADGLGSG